MEEKLYTIILENGNKIENLYLGGNTFISEVPIDPNIFNKNLARVIVSNGEYEEIHENMELAYFSEKEGKWYFVLLDIPKSKIEAAKIRSDLDYLAMMLDVEI